MTPTAHMPPPGIVVMEDSPLSEFLNFGLETSDHTPFISRIIIGTWLPEAMFPIAHPTAHVEPSVAMVTPKRSFSLGVLLGVDWIARSLGEPETT